MSTIKTKTFSSGKAALANARSLQSKGEISKSDLRRVESQVKGMSVSNLGKSSGGKKR